MHASALSARKYPRPLAVERDVLRCEVRRYRHYRARRPLQSPCKLKLRPVHDDGIQRANGGGSEAEHPMVTGVPGAQPCLYLRLISNASVSNKGATTQTRYLANGAVLGETDVR